MPEKNIYWFRYIVNGVKGEWQCSDGKTPPPPMPRVKDWKMRQLLWKYAK